MASERLPEELVHEVLRHCFVASPEIFLDPANDRRYLRLPESPPNPIGRTDVLLVSKRWLRIGTPLLYTSLWLAKSSHTRDVTQLFRSNPHLGTRVLDLRLEGGFEEGLYELLRYTPNVKNVFLAWNVAPSDNVTGLLMGLPSLAPETLYLGYQRYNGGDRRGSDELAKLLEECITKWSSLKHIHFAYWYDMTRPTAQAIQIARSLETLNVHSEDIYNWSWSADLLCFLDNPSLRTVYCRSAAPPDRAKGYMFGQGVRKRIVDSLTFVQHPPEFGIDDVRSSD